MAFLNGFDVSPLDHSRYGNISLLRSSKGTHFMTPRNLLFAKILVLEQKLSVYLLIEPVCNWCDDDRFLELISQRARTLATSVTNKEQLCTESADEIAIELQCLNGTTSSILGASSAMS